MMLWRFVKRTLVTLLITLVVLATILTVALTTQVGGRLAMSAVNPFIPGEVRFSQLQGALLRDFDIQELSYVDGDTAIHIGHLQLRWRPWQLLRGQVHVRSLLVDDVHVRLPEGEPSTSSEPLFPIELPSITLPIEFRLDRSEMTNIALQIGSTEQLVNRIQLRARSREHTLHIYALSITSPEFHGQLHGTITPVAHYPLQLNTLVRIALPEFGYTTIVGQLKGDSQQLRLQQQVSGIANVDINVAVRNPLLPSLQWEGTIRVLHSVPNLVPEVDWLQASINGSGSLTSVAGDFRIEGNHQQFGNFVLRSDASYADERVQLNSLFARVDDYGLIVDWSGNADIIPASDVNATEFNLNMNGLLRYQDYLNADVALSLNGTPEALNDIHFQVSEYPSTLELSGKLGWANGLEWDIALVMQELGLTPLLQEFAPDMASLVTGPLNMELNSSGTWHQQWPSMNVQLAALRSELMNESVTAQASLEWQEENITLHHSALQWGERTLSLQAATNLTTAQSSLQLAAAELAYEDWYVGDLNIDITGDWRLERLPRGSLIVRNVRQLEEGTDDAATHLVEQLQVRILDTDVQPHTHAIEIDGEAFSSELSFAALGRWHNNSWQGELQRLSALHPVFEQWRLREPAQVSLSAEQIQIEHFCIQNQGRDVAGFCLRADWDIAAALGQVHAQADSLQLAMLQPLVAEAFAPELLLDGELNAYVDIDIQEQTFVVDARVALSDTEISLPQQDLQFRLQASDLLRVQGNQQQLDVQVNLQSVDLNGGIRGNATLTDLLASQAISGELDIQLAALGVISLIVPELQGVSGEVAGNIAIAGNLPQPNLTGFIELQNGAAEIPAAGIQLSALDIRLNAPEHAGEPFKLIASARSGDGHLNILGDYQLLDGVANVTITGEQFRAAQTRDLLVTISPNINVRYDQRGVQVRGEITVPSALITPPDIQTIDSPSRDTVIVRGEETLFSAADEQLPIDADVQVILGDNVRVEAFGFDGRLNGRLRVREQPGQPTSAVGTINVVAGRYEIFGQPLDIERGSFTYTGGGIDNPGLDLRVSRNIELENVTVGARIGGALRDPTLSFFSTPNMQDSAVLSYLILGRAPGADSGEQNMFAQATLALGMQGGNFIGQQLGDALGVDEIVLDSTGDNFDNASLYIGKHLSSRLYVRYGIGLIEPVNTFFIRYRLTENLHFESQSGGDRSGADLFFSRER